MSSPSRSDRRLSGRAKLLIALALAVAAGAAVALALGLRDSSGSGDNSGSARAASEWRWAPPMVHRRSYTATGQINSKIYIAAGMVGNTGRPLDMLERFDPATGNWASLKPLPVSFSAGAGAVLDNRLYVVGGDSQDANGRQVFRYDVATNRWQGTTPLPAPRTNLTAVALGGKLYAIGGLDPVEPVSTVFVYDPRTSRWSKAAPLPVALQAMGATVYHGEIWVLGGRVRNLRIQRRVWIYNPKQNRWRSGPSLPRPMDLLGVTTVGNRIHAGPGVGQGRDFTLGQSVCLATPTGARIATCAMVLNNTSWQFTETPCVVSNLRPAHRPVQTRHTRQVMLGAP